MLIFKVGHGREIQANLKKKKKKKCEVQIGDVGRFTKFRDVKKI